MYDYEKRQQIIQQKKEGKKRNQNKKKQQNKHNNDFKSTTSHKPSFVPSFTICFVAKLTQNHNPQWKNDHFCPVTHNAYACSLNREYFVFSNYEVSSFCFHLSTPGGIARIRSVGHEIGEREREECFFFFSF